jgi:hypothetical protein
MECEKYLVQMPLVAGSGTLAPKFIRIRLAELAAPLPDGFIGHDNPTGEQQFFDIAVAETEAEVQPNAMADDLGREAVMFVPVGWCGSVHRSLRTVERYQESTFLSRGAIVEGRVCHTGLRLYRGEQLS